MKTTSIDLSHLTYEELVTLRRHLRAMLILVEQILQYSLTTTSGSGKG
jgi:hypothetical protein